MIRQFILRPRAENDIQSAFEWYESHRPGLGEQFLAAVRERLEAVRNFPEANPVVYRDVRHEGEVAAGDPIEWMNRAQHALTVAQIVGLYAEEPGNREMLRRAAELPALPSAWKDYFRKRL